MTRLAILVACVVVVGCGVDEQRQRQAERLSRIDSLRVESQMAMRRAMAAVDNSLAIIDGALIRAECDSLQSRIDRLAADSARCAESRQGGAINGATWDCLEPWWIIAPCGDTLWGHGCQLDSMGAGMNPDSSYEEARQLLLKCIDGYRIPCDTTGGTK